MLEYGVLQHQILGQQQRMQRVVLRTEQTGLLQRRLAFARVALVEVATGDRHRHERTHVRRYASQEPPVREERRDVRRGDVVVTPDGFLVYRGGSGAHTRDNFEPLTKARDELANLERASRNPGAAYAPVAVADAAPAVAKASPRKPKPQSKAAAPKTIEPKTVEPKDFEAKVSE